MAWPPEQIGVWVALVVVVITAILGLLRERRLKEQLRQKDEMMDRVVTYNSVYSQISAAFNLIADTQTGVKASSPPPIAGVYKDDVLSWLEGLRLPTDVRALWENARSSRAQSVSAASPETNQAVMQQLIDGGLASWSPPDPPPHYHAAVLLLLRALRGLWHPVFRLFHEAPVFMGYARPDFTLTTAREGVATGTNSLLFIEVKHPSAREEGERQLQRYLLRRLSQLVKDAEVAGKRVDYLLTIHAVGVATTLHDMLVQRVFVRKARDGKLQLILASTFWMPLLPRTAPSKPSAGFEALCRLLAAEPQQLGPFSPVPLFVDLPGDRGSVAVEAHLGTGGHSAAFSARVGSQHVVIKRPRHIDARSTAELGVERDVMRDLPRNPHLPRLVDNYNDPGETQPKSLVLLPVGAPATSMMLSFEGGDKTRRAECATHLVGDVMRALRAAHGEGIAHGDVRLANVVAADGAYVLIDWGRAERRAKRRGRSSAASFVAACAADLASAVEHVGLPVAQPGVVPTHTQPVADYMNRVARAAEAGALPGDLYQVPRGLFE